MRLALVDRPIEKRASFCPMALSRPIWESRYGMTSLFDQMLDKVGTGSTEVAASRHGG